MVYDPYYAPNPTNQPLRRKRRAWPWILATVLAVCGIGSVVTFAAIGGGVKAVQQETQSRTADITISGCSKTVIGTVEVAYTLTNSATVSRVYLPEFRLETADGTIVGQAADITPEVPAGKSYKGKAVGTIDDGAGKFTCKLVSS